MPEALRSYLVSFWSCFIAVVTDHNWLLVIFTGLLAVFTLLLAIYTWRLWKDARILQRAYIAVEPLGIHMMQNGSDLIGHVGVKNAGRLPARKVSWFIDITVSENGSEPDEFFPIKEHKGNIVIAPDVIATRGSAARASVTVDGLNKFCQAELGRAKEKRTFLYVWGSVSYDDGFDTNRTTTFCHRYNWINRGRDRPAGVGPYEIDAKFARHHEYGNDAT